MEKKFESETFKQLIGGSTVSTAYSMQGDKFENGTDSIFKT